MDFLTWWDKVPQTHLYDDCGNDISWIFDAIRSGYYVPSVSQTQPGKMTITFTPAGEWLGEPVVSTVNLPAGSKGEPGPQGKPGPKGDPGNILAIDTKIIGTGSAIKTQIINNFNKMIDNTIIGIYVSNSDTVLDGLAFTGIMSKIGSIGSVTLFGVDSDCSIRALIYNGDLTEWRWTSPKNTDGREYLLTENYLGKPVYSKTMFLGQLPQSTTTSYMISETEENIFPIGLEYVVGGSSTSQGTAAGTYPYIDNIYTQSNRIVITTNASDRANIRVTIRYCKQ